MISFGNPFHNSHMSSPTAFQKVKQFMTVAGQTNNTVSTLNDEGVEELKHFRISLIEEEFSELKDAMKKNSRVDLIDAIADLLYVVYGTGVAFDVEVDQAFDVVHHSNMSKFCLTLKEAEDTVEYYTNQYKAGLSSYSTPAYKWENGWYIVYNKETGKILKSINYTPAQFHPSI